MNRQYSGVVDFSLDEETVSKRVDSPPAGSPPLSDGVEVQPQAEPPLPASLVKETPAESASVVTTADVARESAVTTATVKTDTRKRIRVDYPLPTLVVPNPKNGRNTAAAGVLRKQRASAGT